MATPTLGIGQSITQLLYAGPVGPGSPDLSISQSFVQMLYGSVPTNTNPKLNIGQSLTQMLYVAGAGPSPNLEVGQSLVQMLYGVGAVVGGGGTGPVSAGKLQVWQLGPSEMQVFVDD